MTRLATGYTDDNSFLKVCQRGLTRAAQQLRDSYTREEAVVHGCLALIMLTGFTLLIFNMFHQQNTVWAVVYSLISVFPLLILFWWGLAQAHRQKWPYFSLITFTICNSFLFIMVSTLCCVVILTTPFDIIDYHLVKFDQWLGFDVTVLMAWVHHHPYIYKILSFAYDAWYPEVLLTPVVLALLKRSAEVHRYFLGYTFFFLCSALIYYFFPTIAPAGVMNSPYFSPDQYALVTRFFEVHQQLPVSVMTGGIVAFPSVHVATALTVLIAFRKIKIIFYPLLIINTLLIFATMGLGYHYLADVLMSLIVVSVATWVIHLIYKKFIKQDIAFKPSL